MTQSKNNKPVEQKTAVDWKTATKNAHQQKVKIAEEYRKQVEKEQKKK